MTNVIIYCRVSTDEQANGCSLEMQENYLRAYCANRKYNVHDVYHEEYSAKHFDLKRPQMAEMYQYCKKNKNLVNKVLFLRWDRFSRNVEFAFAYKRKFYDELGIEINAIESEIDFKSTEWSMLLAMYCGAAHTEDDKISKRTKDGIHGTLLKGKWPRKAPRGYKNVRHDKHDTEVVVDETIAPQIRTAFQEVAKGQECPCSIRRRVCPSIPENSFLEMLRNIFYMGKIRVPAYGNDEEMIVDGQHQALVDEDTFHRVQIAMGRKHRNYPAKISKTINPDLYLRKIVYCPVCGRKLTGSFCKGNGGRYPYYNCSKDGKHLRMKAEDLNQRFAKFVSNLKPNPSIMKLYNAVLKDIRKEQSRELVVEVNKLKSQVKVGEQKIENAEDAVIAGKIDQKAYNSAIKRYREETEKLNQRIQILEDTLNHNIEPKLNYSISLIDNISKYMEETPVDVRLKIIGSIFRGKIIFDGESYRTNELNDVVDLIYQETKQLRKQINKKNGETCYSPILVPKAGIEPARVLPHWFLRPTRLPIPPPGQLSRGHSLVPFAAAKLRTFFDIAKFFFSFW